MKKNLFYLFALFCSISLFSACSDDDDNGGDPNPPVEEGLSGVINNSIVGNYKAELNVTVLGTSAGSTTTVVKVEASSVEDAISLSITDFKFSVGSLNLNVGDIDLSDCVLVEEEGTYTFTGQTTISEREVATGVMLSADPVIANGAFTTGTTTTMTLNLDIAANLGGMDQDVTVTCTATKLTAEESSVATIGSFAFDAETYDFVCAQPVIDEEAGTIYFRVTDGTRADDMAAMVPTITLTSELATISPDPSEGQNFFNGNVVTYTVTAVDGTTKEYAVSTYPFELVTDFETWVPGNVTTEETAANAFYEVPGWTSSNVGAMLLKSMGKVDSYAVTQTNDAHGGASAASIKTLDSQGGDLYFAKIPKVTPGTLFTGAFVTNITNTLNSTKFGVPFAQQPVSLKGWCKYTAGDEYYVVEEPYAANCHLAQVDPDMVDEGTIAVVLYATDDYSTDWSDCLTGVADTELNIYTSSRVVAIGRLDVAETDWKEFEITLDYQQTYNPSQKYRLAIVCSSSKFGDRFWGAPGSELIVDDFELVVE